MIGNHDSLRANRTRSVIQGVTASALGLLALAIAAVECYVYADISALTSSGNAIFGLSLGTVFYLGGYTSAGVILVAIGIRKIYSASKAGSGEPAEGKLRKRRN